MNVAIVNCPGQNPAIRSQCGKHPQGTISAQVVLATPAPITHRTAEENLGLGYLAAVLRRRGAKVSIIDGWLDGLSSVEIAERILSFKSPLWIGFSCYRSNMAHAIEVVTILRKRGFLGPVVAGGYGPTFHTAEFLDAGFDLVVRGDAEETVLELTEHFSYGLPPLRLITGIAFKEGVNVVQTPARQAIVDLDVLPYPSRDTLQSALKRKSAIHIDSSRGCSAHCVFCSIIAFAGAANGPRWRQRSIAHFANELYELHRQGVTYFKVIDDSFIEPPRDERWCTRLADQIERLDIRVRLRASIRADRVTSGIISELKRAGFFAFSCGIENFSKTALKRMAKTANVVQNLEALEILGGFGMYVQAGHILFDGQTTMGELWENYFGMKKYIWTISKGIFSEMYAAEGTPFTRLLEKRGQLRQAKSDLGNYSYEVRDPLVQKMYLGLKSWHKNHLALYDKAIDAISAPKALPAAHLKAFHHLSVELRGLDLDFMHLLLKAVDAGETDVAGLVDDQLKQSKQRYEALDLDVGRAYRAAGLTYDAQLNPFVA